MNTSTEAFEHVVHTADIWLDEFVRLLAWRDRGKALTAMIAAMHALRDGLPAEEAVYVGANLPTVLRGYYYEGWHPFSQLPQLKTRSAYLNRIQDVLHREPSVEPEKIGRALFTLLASRLPGAELENAKALTPDELRAFWPS